MKPLCNKKANDEHDYEMGGILAGEVCDHVEIYGSNAAQGFLASNIGLVLFYICQNATIL